MTHLQTIPIAGTEYVIIPKAEFQSLHRKAGVPTGSVEALEYGRGILGARLREAREHAQLTQTELAQKLRKSQALSAVPKAGG